MSDFELTKLCAEAMGYRRDADGGFSRLRQGAGMDEPQWMEFIYDPLHFDEQAMALIKRFELAVWGHAQAGEWKFHAECNYTGGAEDTLGLGHGDTHNRAIVECVANMQASKTPAPSLP